MGDVTSTQPRESSRWGKKGQLGHYWCDQNGIDVRTDDQRLMDWLMGISWGCGAVESVATASLIVACYCTYICNSLCSFLYLSGTNFAFVGASWVSCLNNISTFIPLREGYSDALEQREPLLQSPFKSTCDLALSCVLCQTARILNKLVNSLHQHPLPHQCLSKVVA